MLNALVLAVLALWLLALATSTTIGGLIHLLLVVAIVLMLASVLPTGRRRI